MGASDERVYKALLEGQADFFSESDTSWLAEHRWWNSAQHVIQFGRGIGNYLSGISSTFPEKTYVGVESDLSFLDQETAQYAHNDLSLMEGKIEVYDPSLDETADVVLLRLTLQHLDDPEEALRNAARYLKPNGHVLIIDAFDKVRSTFPAMPAVDEALDRVRAVQAKGHQGNREASHDILKSIIDNKSSLSNIYAIEYSNIDRDGHASYQPELYRQASAAEYFNHTLLILTVFHRKYDICIDFDQAYDELENFIHEEGAWSKAGAHFLVLSKI
jgi:SAM-dependent methyltransferase